MDELSAPCDIKAVIGGSPSERTCLDRRRAGNSLCAGRCLPKKKRKGLPARMASRLAFMSRNHHSVRDFAVRELPRQDRPLSPMQIAQVTGLAPQDVSAILADLERNLFFLVREPEGNVSWGFPGHHVRDPAPTEVFNRREDFWSLSGRCLCHVLRARMPLRGEKLRVRVDSTCLHCSRRLALDVDEHMRFQVVSSGASPLIFAPDIDWGTFRGANIIHDY